MAEQRYLRRVEFAVGFTDNTWTSFSVLVPEEVDRALDDVEIQEKAEQMVEEIEFEDKEIVFRTIIFIEDPVGGFAEDPFGYL